MHKHIYIIIILIILIITCGCINASSHTRIALVRPIISANLSNMSLGLPNMEPGKIHDALYQAVDNYLQNKFSSGKYFVCEQEKINNELLKNGYFIDALILPDINTLKNIADHLDADLSMAIEITDLVMAHYNTRNGIALCISVECNVWSRTSDRPYILRIMKVGQDLKLSHLHKGHKPLETFIADLASVCLEEIWNKINL